MYLANTATFAGPQVGFRFPGGSVISTGDSSLIGPLTAVTTPSPVVIRAGDTEPSFLVMLASANGPSNVSNDNLTLFLRAVWDLSNISGGTVAATSTTGQVICTLPTLTRPGYYYGYITDGFGASYPNSGAGFLITVAPAATS